MSRESFEDKEVAELLNRLFIPVKIDREERPDLDQLYMSACQAMTGQGGWPLTVILTPDGKPFFAGTYFPRESREGLPGLRELLTKISRMWKQERRRVQQAGEELFKQLKERKRPRRLSEKEGDDERLLSRAFRLLQDS